MMMMMMMMMIDDYSISSWHAMPIESIKVLSWITHPGDISPDLCLAPPAILGPLVWRYALFHWFNYYFVFLDFVLKMCI